jgi:hypothetical protein
MVWKFKTYSRNKNIPRFSSKVFENFWREDKFYLFYDYSCTFEDDVSYKRNAKFPECFVFFHKNFNNRGECENGDKNLGIYLSLWPYPNKPCFLHKHNYTKQEANRLINGHLKIINV